MKDSQLKWASCCSKAFACHNCEKCDECEKWYRYVKAHENSKGYAHFDRRTSLKNNKTRQNVLNPEWVAMHAFWPLIQFEISKDKFVGKKESKPAHLIKKSPRLIRYCAHLDRCVYQRYSFLLDQLYNLTAIEKGIDEVAVAYRTNKSLNNLHLAKRALDFIEAQEECLVLVSDFDSFFARIDHVLLKEAICDLMGVEHLPDDYYAVFKNITNYSSWSWKSLMLFWQKRNPEISRKDVNSKEIILPRSIFRELRNSEVLRNEGGRGIPQGSPISAVLSNIYLLAFDEEIHALVNLRNGLYMRYCDDLLVIIPIDGSGQELAVINELVDKIDLYPGVEIKEDKTALLKYSKKEHHGRRLVSIDRATGVSGNEAMLDYLGITFDGENRRIRARAISKYHYRMHRKAKTIAHQQKGRKNIYGVYSERAMQLTGHRSFVDYIKCADNILGLNDPEAKSVAVHNMEKIAKAINKASKGSVSKDSVDT